MGYLYFDVPPPNLIEALQRNEEAMCTKENEDDNHDNFFVEQIYDGHNMGEAVDGDEVGVL